MLILFIIIQLTFEVQYYGQDRKVLSKWQNSFLTFTPSYNDKQPHFTGGAQLFTGGGPAPSAP